MNHAWREFAVNTSVPRGRRRVSLLATSAAVAGALLAIPALSACQPSTSASEVGAKAVDNAAPGTTASPTPTPTTPLIYPADPPPVTAKSAPPTPGDNIGDAPKSTPAPKPVAAPVAKPKPAPVKVPKKPVCAGLNLQLAKDSWSITTTSKRLIAIADLETKRTQADLKSAEALNDTARVTTLRSVLTQYTELAAKANANKTTADAMLVRIKATCKIPKGTLN